MFPPRLRRLSLASSLLCACGSNSSADDPEDESVDVGEVTESESGASCDPTPEALPSQRVFAVGDRFVDALGRESWLRGVNAGGRSKFAPFFPFPFAESGIAEQADDPSFDEALSAYADRVHSWGHNTVRVPFVWEAAEPQPGSYDELFLQRYRAMLQAFGDRGIRVIVDAHQDVYSRHFCGDGFPPWAVINPPSEFPAVEDCEFWSNGYFANPGVNENFDHFWANGDGLRDQFTAMWSRVVQDSADLDFVIGYEILNEPHFGSEAEGEWVTGTLPDFYEATVEPLRALAPEALWFFGLGALDGVDGQTELRALEGDNWAFAPHYYDQEVFLGGPDDTSADAYEGISPWAEQGRQWERPVLLGEFGVKTSFDGSPAWIAQNFDALDQALLSGTVWEYSSTADDWNNEGFGLVEYGGVETPSVEAIVRVYPAAVAGQITSFGFDSQTRVAQLEWEVDEGVSELAVPTRLYPDGVEVELSGVEGCWSYDAAAQRVYVRATGTGTAALQLSPA